jgi:hypothetical protein
MNKVPKIIMRRLRLRECAIGLFFGSVDEVGKLDRVLNKKHRDIVADNVPVAFFGVELHAKSRTSRARSAEPLFPATVEKRTKAGIFSPSR